jgi:hypothetical protein
LLTVQRPGRKRRVSSTAQRDVQRAFLSGQLRTLAEARAYLHTQHGVSYQSLSSVWLLLPQHRPYLRRNQQPRSGEEVASSDPGNTLTPVNGAPEPTSQWKAT